MNSQALCFVLVIFIPGFVFMESVQNENGMEKCKQLYEPPVDEHALINHVVWLTTAETADLCLVECKLEEDCVSYNVAPSNETQGWFYCELSDSDRHMSPDDFVKKRGYTYRGKKNPCDPNPCTGPKSVCNRTGYDFTGYECVCPATYSGDYCEQDVNECASSLLNNCTGPGVICENTNGSFLCVCEDGYVGDGIKCEKKASWIKMNVAPLCVGVKDNSYGAVDVPDDVNVTQIKLVHVSGAVSWHNNPMTAGNWGEKAAMHFLFFVITDMKNQIIAPYPGYPFISREYYTIPNITVSSPELIFPTSDPPLPLERGDPLRVWYTYDLYDYLESDQYGHSCTDLYIRL